MLQYCIKQIWTSINKYILHVLSIKLRYKLYFSFSIPTLGFPHFYYMLGANLGLLLYGEVSVMHCRLWKFNGRMQPTLGYWRVTSWCRSWQRYVFCWNIVNFKGDKIPLKQSYDKQDVTLVVISYEIYETRPRLVSSFHKFHMKWPLV